MEAIATMTKAEKKKMSIEENQARLQEQKNLIADESSIFSTILADIDENPAILQKQKKFSIFSTFLAEVNPTILQKKTFTCPVSKTLTHSDLIDILNQELKILVSETETKGQTSVSCNPNYDSECDCVQEGKVVEQHVEAELISTDAEEDGDNILKNLDEMLSTMLGDEDAQGLCGVSDEFIEELLGKIENDGSYLERVKDEFLFGGLLEDLLRDKLREKAEKEEKEVSSWITNGDSEVAEEEKRDIIKKKKKSPVKVKMERSEQESTMTKRDCIGYKRRIYLVEKLRERDENQRKRRVEAVRLGVELSFLVAEFMFLIPNKLLASEIEDYWMYITRFRVINGDDKGTSVITGKLEEVFDIVVMRKKVHHYNMNLPESVFWFEDYILLCIDAIQVLGKIVWALRRSNQFEGVKLSDLDSWFEDCSKVLMKIELKLAEMKQRVYRSVYADYESFSKAERLNTFLLRKLMNRANADNGLRDR